MVLFYQILCARPFGEMRGKYLLPCVVFFCAQCVLNAAVLVRVSEADSGVTIEASGSYVFGDPIQSSGTIEGETLSSIGLTPSEITWSWSLGSNSDSLTLLIVPEPSVALLLISAALFLGRRRRV